MSVHGKPIAERLKWLQDLARSHSATYCSPESFLARERYLAEHPTDIVVLKCMDGRINIPVATKTPQASSRPSAIWGACSILAGPHLGEVLANHVHGVVSHGRRVLMLITYHFSKGDKHRGCAGFCYDTEAAITHTYAIKEQVEHVFGRGHGTVYPVVCGFETDEDAIILHGNNGDTLEVATLDSQHAHTLGRRLGSLFPDMPDQI